MTNQAEATAISSLAAITETVDRGFDWGSAAIGVGAGAAIVLLILALATALRGRGNGSHPRGGNPS
jgi:hypothetical protein